MHIARNDKCLKSRSFPQLAEAWDDNALAMTQIAPTFQQSRVREQGSDKVHEQGHAEGTQAGVFTHKPTAAIYGGSDQQQGNNGGDHPNGEAVQFLRDANTGQLRSVARNVVRTERMQLFPSSSPMRLIGPTAQPAVFERETKAHINRRNYLPTQFSQQAKFSSLSGARITFGEEDQPFNSAVPFNARQTTMSSDEHRQMSSGMMDAQFNQGPVAWGLRHGAIRV